MMEVELKDFDVRLFCSEQRNEATTGLGHGIP